MALETWSCGNYTKSFCERCAWLRASAQNSSPEPSAAVLAGTQGLRSRSFASLLRMCSTYKHLFHKQTAPQIEERKKHQARLLEQLNSINVPGQGAARAVSSSCDAWNRDVCWREMRSLAPAGFCSCIVGRLHARSWVGAVVGLACRRWFTAS
jgi:hypothetical protein